MDPAEGLARLERMAQRAKERRAKAEVEERFQQAVEEAEQVRQELRAAQEHYLEGPPDGCRSCYYWNWTPWHGWTWHHGAAFKPEVRPWAEADGELVEFCTHYCHGPEGKPLPVIAYA